MKFYNHGGTGMDFFFFLFFVREMSSFIKV